MPGEGGIQGDPVWPILQSFLPFPLQSPLSICFLCLEAHPESSLPAWLSSEFFVGVLRLTRVPALPPD